MTAVRALVSVMVFLVLVAVGPRPVQAQDASAPDLQAARTLVRSAIDTGLSSFVGKPLAERERLLDGLLRRYSDPTMLAANILGRHWGKISPAEQTAFTETFMRYLVSSYVGLLKNVHPDVTVDVGEAIDTGERIQVLCVAHMPSDPGAPVPVVWDVATTAEGKPVLMDVTADGVSIIRAMREDFASVLRRSGGAITPLMEALQRKIAANDRDNAAQ